MAYKNTSIQMVGDYRQSMSSCKEIERWTAPRDEDG